MARRISAIQFLLVMILWIVVTPFLDELLVGGILQAALLTLVLISAILIVGADRGRLVLASILAAPTLLAKWGNLLWPAAFPAENFLVPGLLFMAYVVISLFRYILAAPRVDVEVLCAAVANYLLLGLLWMFAYLLVDRLLPGSFAFVNEPVATRAMDSFSAFYFSLVTLNTLGYGDIVPVSQVARMLAVVEAASGIFYMTVLIARLVALYSSEGGRRPSC